MSEKLVTLLLIEDNEQHVAVLRRMLAQSLESDFRLIHDFTLAEGIAVKNVGQFTLPLIRELVSKIILVNEAQLERAVNAYLTLQKTMAEGAGAASLAALRQ